MKAFHGHYGSGDNQYLCCYFIADHEINTEELAEYASRSLPLYGAGCFQRASWKMPMTPNGKVDKKALNVAARFANPKPAETPMQKKILRSLLRPSEMITLVSTPASIKQDSLHQCDEALHPVGDAFGVTVKPAISMKIIRLKNWKNISCWRQRSEPMKREMCIRLPDHKRVSLQSA